MEKYVIGDWARWTVDIWQSVGSRTPENFSHSRAPVERCTAAPWAPPCRQLRCYCLAVDGRVFPLDAASAGAKAEQARESGVGNASSRREGSG